ncbi:MAG: hypothetical protein SGI83_14500 [Bacteroidota bacterium]|nr:hypothetical protein [Bacteroidota bacterium]
MIKTIFLILYTAIFATNTIAQNCSCEELNKGEKVSTDILISSSAIFCRAKGFEQATLDYLNKKDLDSAEIYLKQAEVFYKQAACNEEQWFPIYKLRASLHFFRAEYQPALDYSLKVLAVSQKKENLQQEADILLSISNIFGRTGQPEKGLSYCRLAVPVIEKIKSAADKVDMLNKLGSRYYFFFQDTKSQSLFDTAAVIFKEALIVANQINYRKGKQVSYNKMNTLAYRKNDYALALLYLDSSIAMHQPGENINILASSFGDKGNILLKMGKFAEAKKWADSCLYYNMQEKFPPLISNAYSLVAEIADSLGDYKTAYTSLNKEKKITDSLTTADKTKAVNEIEKKYNQAKNEKTIKELSQQKLIYALLGLGGLLIAGLIAFYFR